MPSAARVIATIKTAPGVAARHAWSSRAVALHASSILGGWALLTWGLARLLVPEVWLISGGLLLLSIAGWGHLRIVFTAGAYALMRAGRAGKL